MLGSSRPGKSKHETVRICLSVRSSLPGREGLNMSHNIAGIDVHTETNRLINSCASTIGILAEAKGGSCQSQRQSVRGYANTLCTAGNALET